jgi:DNA-binding transcriptional ArsR family regulator
MARKLRALSLSERTELTLTEIGAQYGVTIRTVSRWLADARDFLDELEAAQQ